MASISVFEDMLVFLELPIPIPHMILFTPES